MSLHRCKPYRISDQVREIVTNTFNEANIALNDSLQDNFWDGNSDENYWEFSPFFEEVSNSYVDRNLRRIDPRAQEKYFSDAKIKDISELHMR